MGAYVLLFLLSIGCGRSEPVASATVADTRSAGDTGVQPVPTGADTGRDTADDTGVVWTNTARVRRSILDHFLWKEREDDPTRRECVP